MTKLLVVDDNEQNLYLLRVLLEGSAYEVVSATNGAEALEMARRNPPDMIITDILMPVMDGFTLCRQWKADETLNKIPFVFFTATYTDPKDEELALSLGAERFIVKPAEPDVFVGMLEEVVRTHKASLLVAPREPVAEETVYLKEYNETLIRKLESKMLTLEKANRALEREAEEKACLHQELQIRAEELDQCVAERTAQLELMVKELEAFSYSVSHDLRAPLRALNGFSQALLEDWADKLDEQGKQYLNRVRNAARRMSALIDDLLELFRVSRSDVCKNHVDLSAMAKEIAAELQQAQPDRQVEFVATDGIIAEADPTLLRAAMANLIGNAWKFTGKKPAARVEFGTLQSEGERAYFVRDNGAGFDMAYSNKLYKPFERLHSPGEYEGTGIGLATVRRIVERHGGRMWAESQVDRGATFTFTLGAVGSASPDNREQPTDPMKRQPHGKRPRRTET